MFILITGGSASGKSGIAEKFAAALCEKPVYMAAMLPYGDEANKRIARHRAQRAERNFVTVEKYFNIKNVQEDIGQTVLFECMSNLLANEMFDERGLGENAVSEITAGIERLRKITQNLIVVTNDIFCEGVCYDRPIEEYIKNLGKINRFLVSACDEAYEAVCGIPIKIKGEGICLKLL